MSKSSGGALNAIRALHATSVTPRSCRTLPALSRPTQVFWTGPFGYLNPNATFAPRYLCDEADLHPESMGRQWCGPSGRSATSRCECSMTMDLLAAAANGILRRSADHVSGRSKPHQTRKPKPTIRCALLKRRRCGHSGRSEFVDFGGCGAFGCAEIGTIDRMCVQYFVEVLLHQTSHSSSAKGIFRPKHRLGRITLRPKVGKTRKDNFSPLADS